MKTIQFIIAILLLPLSIWYAVGVALRNCYYNHRDKKKNNKSIVNCQLSTIGIGNLRMGGTGKTPHTEYLIRLFSDRPTALLSRGYGRKTKGFVLADNTSDATTLGDEPAMIARKFPGLTVTVCEDRVEGINRLAKLPQPPELVLLDDVYQYRRIKPSVLILLTEYGDPFSDDHILPFGNLREFRSGRRRADIVVVTKCPPSLSEKRRNEIREKLKLSPHQQLFFSHIDYLPPQPLFGNNTWHTPKEILLVTGIAHPEPLLHHLELQCTVKHLRFPDHHDFTNLDCTIIKQSFNKIQNTDKLVVTTEKDAMRLIKSENAKHIQNLPVYYVPITVKMSEEEQFNTMIIQKIIQS